MLEVNLKKGWDFISKNRVVLLGPSITNKQLEIVGKLLTIQEICDLQFLKERDLRGYARLVEIPEKYDNSHTTTYLEGKIKSKLFTPKRVSELLAENNLEEYVLESPHKSEVTEEIITYFDGGKTQVNVFGRDGEWTHIIYLALTPIPPND